MQDVIHWNNFFEHWNKQHTDFEQSSTDILSPGNGVVRSPGDEVITFVPGLDFVSSRKMWVYDYKDGILQEWRKCFLIILCSLARKKVFYGKNFQYQENICETGKAGGCCSNQEGWNVCISPWLSPFQIFAPQHHCNNSLHLCQEDFLLSKQFRMSFPAEMQLTWRHFFISGSSWKLFPLLSWMVHSAGPQNHFWTALSFATSIPLEI